jgi:aspartyl-tRNA(Asn)/glutamyl-tRNA(Gln) amidotransferase subunit C
MISKKELENLAGLARIELKKEEEEKLLKDLEEILKYFEELKEIDTTGVSPMAGGTFTENVFREDEKKNLGSKNITDSFPETKDGFLKIPPVFE